jgi:hypothetical protein
MWIFALPLFLEMDVILQIWLKHPPEYAVLFTRLALVEVLINSISLPITTAARAPGKMKIYEFTLGCIQLGIFLTSWIILKMGADAYSVFIVAIVANLIMFIVRLIIVRSLIGLSLKPYFDQVVIPIILVSIVSVMPSYAIHFILSEGFVFVCMSVLISMLFSTMSMYFIGLDRNLRDKILNAIKRRIYRLFYI